MDFSGDLVNLMESFLSERFERVLNCQSFKWASIKAGVAHGSISFTLLGMH